MLAAVQDASTTAAAPHSNRLRTAATNDQHIHRGQSSESVTSNVPLDVNVWMVYSPDVVTVPPVAREEEHEPLGDAGDAGDGDAALGSLNTSDASRIGHCRHRSESAPMATYFPSPESDKDVGA